MRGNGLDGLRVDGACNLRDLGGLLAADGRRVRRGRLIRSGELSGLTTTGATCLLQLGLSGIVDFRSASERKAAPTRALELGTVRRWQSDADERLGEPLPALRRCLASPAQSRQVVIDIYRDMAFRQHANFRLLFEAVLTGQPVLFHCAAGKDRTGVGAALLLSVLGVSRDQIRHDYLLSNAAQTDIRTRFLLLPGAEIALEAPDEHWAPLMTADADYLDAMFGEVERRHGNVERYATEVLGLQARQLEHLRNALLETPGH